MSASVPPSGSTSPLAFPGAVVAGKYRLESVIGVGGMGSVWCATHLGLAQQVAIKLVSSNFARSSDALRRFDREAKAAAKIRSRHVPQVFDNGVLDDGTPFLAMELLHGETLFKRIHRQGPIPLPEAVSILEQSARALSRAHSLGIVHRDIKPDNIYLAQSVDEDGYVVKILDFGIAKFTGLGDAEHSTTRTGALLGTPQYMSPEQARGLRQIDFRTDLYSLGLVSYTMLTGNLAFSGESLGDLLLQICAQPLPSLRAAAPWLPPAMEAWFQRACAREADHRYPSAQAFIDALRSAAGADASPGLFPTPATTATPVSTTGEAASMAADVAGRKPWVPIAIAIAAALGLAISVGGIVLLLQMRRPSHPATSPVAASSEPTPEHVSAAHDTPAATLDPIPTTTPTTPPRASVTTAMPAAASAPTATRGSGGPSRAGGSPAATPTGNAPSNTQRVGGSRPAKPSATVDLGY
jgi:serine/threonine-protein kinase